MFLRKGVLKICSKFTGEHPCQSAISIKLLCFAFCKLNERSSLPSGKWRLSFFSEKTGFNILHQLGSFPSAKPLSFLHLSEILCYSAFSVVYFLRSFSSEVSNGVYSWTTPFTFIKISASLTPIKSFSLRFWSNIFWISVTTSLFAAFFRASSPKTAANCGPHPLKLLQIM